MTAIYTMPKLKQNGRRNGMSDGLYQSDINPNQKKHYALTMLPYPSGNLHIGHWYAMTPSDARARYYANEGF